MVSNRRLIIVLVSLVLLLAAGLGTAAAQGSNIVHTVRIGDTVSGIAWQYGTTIEALASLNGIPFPYWIFPGQQLVIPATGGPVTAPPTTTYQVHVVRSGENLFRIGLLYGYDVTTMAAFNGLLDPNRIYIGQALIVPGTVVVQPQPAVHVVRSGETLSGIAQLYGVSQASLLAANNLFNPNLITIGQVLVIP